MPPKWTPKAYEVGRHTIKPYEMSSGDSMEDLIRDPRGVLWMWEPPKPTATYVMSSDASFGIPNWSRLSRSKEDFKTDNGVIQVVKCGDQERGVKDVQVAEWAGPVDAEGLADIANQVGRMYAGKEEDGQCECIIEVLPGPGLMMQQRMFSVHGYTNLFRWQQYGKLVPQETKDFGWYSNRQTVPLLWMRGTRHIQLSRIQLNSPALIDEMANAEMDVEKNRGKAIYGSHDDRVTAILLSIWVANKWSLDIESERQEFREVDVDTVRGDWQSSAVTAAQMMEEWEEKFDSLLDA